MQRLLSKQEGLKNPHLAPVGRFLFGLANEKRARELGTTFGCPVSTEVKQELLECRVRSAQNRHFSSVPDTKETLYCLYKSQEEPLVKEAMAQVTEVALHLQDPSDIVHASFCLKHCENLQKMWLRVERGCSWRAMLHGNQRLRLTGKDLSWSLCQCALSSLVPCCIRDRAEWPAPCGLGSEFSPRQNFFCQLAIQGGERAAQTTDGASFSVIAYVWGTNSGHP